ncbi:MAG TPA: GNAT family N-acetyltransferase [Beijerinckiaceae bacterium]|jgi:hypothetical protein
MEARSSAFLGIDPVSIPAPPSRPRPAWMAPGGGYEVELRAVQDVGADIEAWQDLAGRAMEPGLFAHPAVLLPALQHLPDGRQATLLLVWQQAPRRVLRGLFPVLMPRLPLAPGEVRLWRPAAFPVAAALLDRERSEAVLGAALSFCDARGPRCASLVLTAVLADGPLARSCAAAAAASRRRIEPLPLPYALAAASLPSPEGFVPRRDRQLRIGQARSPAQVRDAVETFLVVDAAAAKARGAAALIQDPGMASFVRTMTRELARRGRCRVDVLRQGGDPVAAAIVIEDADALWLWRAAAVPGGASHADRLVVASAARARRSAKRLIVTDAAGLSSEAAGALGLKPLGLADLLVSTRPGHSPGAAAIRLKVRVDRGLRRIAAAGLQRLARA